MPVATIPRAAQGSTLLLESGEHELGSVRERFPEEEQHEAVEGLLKMQRARNGNDTELAVSREYGVRSNIVSSSTYSSSKYLNKCDIY